MSSKYHDQRAGHTYYVNDEEWAELCAKFGEDPEKCWSMVFGLEGGHSYTVEPLQARKEEKNDKT